MMMGQLVERVRHELFGDSPTWARLVKEFDKTHVFVFFHGTDFFGTMAITDSTDTCRWSSGRPKISIDFSWTMAITDSTDMCHWSSGRPMISVDRTLLLAVSTGQAMKPRRRRP